MILVYDITNRKSFENLENWREEYIIQVNQQDPINYPFIVIGNKTDLEDKRAVSEREARNWCEKFGDIPYFETSALNGSNVESAFKLSVTRALVRSS